MRRQTPQVAGWRSLWQDRPLFRTIMSHVRALDGLRAIAILLVILVHFRFAVDFGWAGVQLFFVLSGFLITRILVNAKRKLALGGYLRSFYARRALRIFPLYFGFLLLLELSFWIEGVPGSWPEVRPWALTYTMNIGLMLDRIQMNPLYVHFWTLSVEEQFYLIWPLFVWFSPPEKLGRRVLALIVAGPLLRWAAALHDGSMWHLYFSTLSHVDAFAAGAAVTVFDFSAVRSGRKVLLIAGAVALVAGGASYFMAYPREAILSLGYPEALPDNHEYIWGYTLLNAVSAAAVLCCLRGELRILEHRALREIGRVSYGIYVLHRPLLTALFRMEPRLATALPNATARTAVLFVAYGGLSYIFARLSYDLFESRFLTLKEYFRMEPVAAEQVTSES